MTERSTTGWDGVVPAWLQLDRSYLEETSKRMFEAAGLRPGFDVLDVACGDGEPGLSATPVVAPGQVIGVDLARDMVEAANHKARARGHGSYRAVVGDARSLACADQSFDAVLCRFGLPFMPEPERPVQEMLRVVKRGRRACFALWAEPADNPWIAIPLQAIHAALGDERALDHRPGFFQFSTTDRLEDMIRASGRAGDIELGVVAGLRAVEGAARFWHTLRAAAAPIAAALARVPAVHRSAIDERVIAAYSGYESAGRVELPYKAWLITVTRW